MGRSATTAIEVHKGDGQRYHSVVHRHDGVTVDLDGGSYNRVGGPVARLPHDIAHLIVEQALGLERGLWGVLAGGGLVQNATFAGGRRPPHADRRAWAVTDAAGEDLRQAEVLVWVVADLAAAGSVPPDLGPVRAAVGERWWRASITAGALTAACAALRAAAREWADLPAGGVLALEWPGPTAGAHRAGHRRGR